MKTTKNFILCITIIAVVFLQLMSPVSVRADGETPPPSTDVTTPTPDPAKTNASSPIELEASDLEIKTPEESIAEQESVAEAVPEVVTMPQAEVDEPMSLLETAQEIADNTNVVVLDESGEPLPLAAQEAVEIIVNSDPVWCPAGQAPTPGANGCTNSYATLGDLVANEGGNIAADGTIWMTPGNIPDASIVTINGLTYSTWSNYALTLQGGWSGMSGDPSLGSNSTFTVPIAILNWNNSIVLNNINLENVTTSAQNWLQMQSNSGDITISNSNISDNTNISEWTAGVRLYTPGTVTINNSNFNNNMGQTFIYSDNLTINDSNFTNTQNALAAADYFTLIDCSPGTVSNIFISNSNFNNNSGGSGFSVTPVSPLCYSGDGQYHINTTIDNSSFNDNMGAGAVLPLSNVTINNSIFNNNSNAGVEIAGNGTINNSILSGNGAGAILTGTLTLNDVTIAHNDVGLEAGCDLSAIKVMLNNVSFVGNGIDIGSKFLSCEHTMEEILSSYLTISFQSEGEFALDCASVDGYSVSLVNGDLVQLFCPVSGTARISHLDDSALPAPLPDGFSYASAFSLEILQNENPTPILTEGGFLKASFSASALPAENACSVLYWDNGRWLPLNELNFETPEDPRAVLSDVQLISYTGSPRVEVSTNFPGIFVLAQQ